MTDAPLIWLINPPSGLYRRDDRCQSRVEDQTARVVFPPIELATAAAVARASGWEAIIRDYPAMSRARRRADWTVFEQDLAARPPDALAINTTAATAAADLAAANLARRARGAGPLVIARGESLRSGAARWLGTPGGPDVIVVGEIEAILPELLAAWRGAPVAGRAEALRRLAADRAGLLAPGADGAIVGGGRALAENLDLLPLPARDLLDNGLYRSPDTGRPITVIQAHRGCPSKCVFCPAGQWSGYRVRFRSPAGVIQEIRECVERHGIRDFLFNGDTFTIRKSWVLELCRGLIDARLPIRWGCNSRVDTFDDERADWMRRAGCWVVAFGVESGSQAMLDRMGKGARVEQAAEAVAAARRHGLRVHTFYVIGLPWETRETLAETLDFARRLDADFFDFNLATPLPGTELWDLVESEGLWDGARPAEGTYASASIRSRELPAEELTAWRRRTLLRLSLRPGYILRTLWQARSPRMLGRYLAAGFGRLLTLLR